MKKNNLYVPVLASSVFIFFALLGNIFSNEFNWGIFDFVLMGALVFVAVLLVDIFVKRVKDNKYRLIFSLLILLLFLYVWAELAVGLFFSLGR